MSENFIEINELRLPVAINSPEREPQKRGARFRSWNGRPLRVVTKRVNNFTLETTPLKEKQASMFYDLLEGRGHFYPFTNDPYSTKGLSPKEVSDVLIVSGYHNEGLEVNDTAKFYLPDSDWTSLFWYYDSDVGWTHYTIDSEGNTYEDAVSGSELPADVYIGNFDIKFSDCTISDLIILPFLVTEKFIESRYNSTRQFSHLPRLDISGKAVTGVQVYEAEIANTNNVPFFRDGVFHKKGKVLSIEFIQK